MATLAETSHRRRRWLIAVVSVFALGAWWLWPRTDPRFVGTWDFVLEVNEPRLLGRVTLHDDGRLSNLLPANAYLTLPSSWSVESNVLICGSRVPSYLRFAAPVIVPLMVQLTGRPDWGTQVRFEIRECSRDRVLMRHEVNKGTFLLRREPAQSP